MAASPACSLELIAGIQLWAHLFSFQIKHIRSKPPGGEQPAGPVAPVVPATVEAGVTAEQELQRTDVGIPADVGPVPLHHAHAELSLAGAQPHAFPIPSTRLLSVQLLHGLFHMLAERRHDPPPDNLP